MASLFQDLIDLKNEALESKTILRPSQLDDLKNKKHNEYFSKVNII